MTVMTMSWKCTSAICKRRRRLVASREAFDSIRSDLARQASFLANASVTGESQIVQVAFPIAQPLQYLGTRFSRGDTPRSGTGTGAGLGLAIARELVEREDGTISVESDIGAGTVFSVTLPRTTD